MIIIQTSLNGTLLYFLRMPLCKNSDRFHNGVAFDAKQDNKMLSMHVLYTLTPPAVIQQQEEIIRSWKTLKISKIQISK